MTRVFVALVLVAACGGSTPDEDVCSDAEVRAGKRVCAHSIENEAQWQALSVPASAIDQARTTKYFVPAKSSARLPTLIMDVNSFTTHFQMMVDAFGDRFAGLSLAEYVQIITHPEHRELFAGSLTEYIGDGGARIFGYVVWDDQAGADSAISCAQFRSVHTALGERFLVGELKAIAATGYQRDVLDDCDVPSYDPSTAVDYEAYSQAVGYGTVRRYRVGELPAATANAEFGFQDILILDEAPLDVETIISGAVTGTRQGELSHLNVRATARGTPNCYVRDAYSRFAEWQGKLVRIECGANELTIAEASQKDAQAWWDQLRPDPVDVPTPDVAYTSLVRLLAAPTDSAAERATSLSRFGAKGANLAALYQRIDPALQLIGFLIPMHYYDAFMRNNSWTTDLGDGPEQLSFADTITRYLSDAEFLTSGSLRRTRLESLRQAMRASSCDATLMADIADEIRGVFGNETTMVRFRSSSNAEDSLAFNGAGLYESTSVCLADDTDSDDIGPSRCDVDKAKERGVCRGLTKVWASLWLPKAFDERSWFGIDHAQVTMGILVNTRSKGERANIVAFTGDPNRAADPRYLVNAQVGHKDVVSAEPGVYPEKNLLTVEAGSVTDIERARGSTELPAGQYVLSNAQLEQLGGALHTIDELYPVDGEPPATGRLLLDTEWKVLSDGRLIIKQVRPFAAK